MATLDQAVLSDVQYMLLEPPDGGQAWPSGLWTRSEILALLNQRQDQLLSNTTILVKESSSIPVGIGVHLLALPTDWLRTLSVVWVGNDGVIKELQRSDTFELDHGLPTWNTTNAAYPLTYIDDDVPGSLQIRIGPAPTVAGNLVLLYVYAGAALTGNGVALTVPDELAHAVKYGLLASALQKDGRGRDIARAQYCQQRVDLAEMAAALILRGGG